MTPYYQRDNITLYHGDCFEIMPQLERKVEVVITDPPYGTTSLTWDDTIDLEQYWKMIKLLVSDSGQVVMFAKGRFMAKLMLSNERWFRYDLIWKKTVATRFLDAKRRPLDAHESILLFAAGMKGRAYNPQKQMSPNIRNHERKQTGNRSGHYSRFGPSIYKGGISRYPHSVIEFSNGHGGVNVLHPTQKPLNLMTWLVKTYSHTGDLILDPFAGSGSTGLAAFLLKRHCVLIEQEEAYCEIAAKRLQEAQPPMFVIDEEEQILPTFEQITFH